MNVFLYLFNCEDSGINIWNKNYTIYTFSQRFEILTVTFWRSNSKQKFRIMIARKYRMNTENESDDKNYSPSYFFRSIFLFPNIVAVISLMVLFFTP